MLKSVTAALQHPGCQWDSPVAALVASASSDLQSINKGLYAMVQHNDSDFPIWDRNRSGAGRIILPERSRVIKYGKFQGGFLARMKQNWDHLHRRPTNGSEQSGIFPSVVVAAIVLDLSGYATALVDPAHAFEPYWNQSIEACLRADTLLRPKQPRGESRVLSRPLATSAVDDETVLRAIVEPVGTRIVAAAAAMYALPQLH